MGIQTATRLERARGRVAGAKRLLTAGAATGFVAAALLGRLSHPGHATTQTGVAGTGQTSTPTSVTSDDGFDDFDFSDDSGSSSGTTIAPSTAPPQVQSSVS